MVSTQHTCAKCGSEQIIRNGHSGGHARYQCKDCGHRARFVPAAAEWAVRYAQVEKLLAERNSQRNSQRSIVRATGVSRRTIAGRQKKSPDRRSLLAAPATQKGG